jgi:hypothetical protein
LGSGCYLLELIFHFVDAGIDAGLIDAGRAGEPNSADYVIADLDRHAAADGDDVGQGGLLPALSRQVKEEFAAFNPSGLSDHVAEMSAEIVAEAEQRWKWINETVHDHVVSLLEENYGDNFFQAAIANREIKKKALEKMMDDPADQQKPPEVYLDFIQLKTIIEQKENWPLFASTLSIQMPDENKGRAKYLDWFDRINKIRRIFAHSYGRKLEESDVETLAVVEGRLRERLPDSI